jgi:hypothetical protein
MPPAFIPGLELNRRFYWEAVRPLLDAHFPGLPHAAARLGYGSDVLGFDTPMSMDHDWGPRLHVFLRSEDTGQAEPVTRMLAEYLPFEFLGFPTAFTPPNTEGTTVLQPAQSRPLNHAVWLVSVEQFFQAHLGWELTQSLSPVDWLSVSSQTLRELTAGEVFFDGFGDLTDARQRLAFYPQDVWLYLLACGWQRIGQEGHLMPRAGYVGDELGSALMGSRLVRDVISLCFLMERQYAPYPKWFGTAFQRLACASEFSPRLWQAQLAPTWQEREAALGQCYSILARLHNRLALTPSLPEMTTPFFDRPFQVIQDGLFVQALLAQVTDPQVLAIAGLGRIGSLDQFSDNTDLRSVPAWRARLRRLLDPEEQPHD